MLHTRALADPKRCGVGWLGEPTWDCREGRALGYPGEMEQGGKGRQDWGFSLAVQRRPLPFVHDGVNYSLLERR